MKLFQNGVCTKMRVRGLQSKSHNDCDLTSRGHDSNGVLRFYCEYHQQWAYLFPVSRTYAYAPESEMPDITIELGK